MSSYCALGLLELNPSCLARLIKCPTQRLSCTRSSMKLSGNKRSLGGFLSLYPLWAGGLLTMELGQRTAA